MPAIIRQSWRDQCEKIKYPFADTATLLNSTGDVIPDALFLDGILHPIGGDSSLFISKIEILATTVVFWFSCEITDICSATFSKSSVPSVLQVLDAYDRPAGKLVADASLLTSVASWPLGDHLFADTATGISPSAILPMPEVGVRGLVLESGEIFSGPVTLVGEDGVYFRTEDRIVSGEIVPVVMVDASGDPLFLRKSCEEEAAIGAAALDDGPFLKTINGEAPDDDGNFIIFPGNELVEDTVVRITPSGNGLVVNLVGSKVNA